LNYLAHLYLSGQNPSIISGNFIADAVKGNQYLKYSPEIIVGIKLHRFIDDFTDNHPIVERSKSILRPTFRKFSGIIIDIFYDHFLAKHWDKYSTTSLNCYTQEIYSMLQAHIHCFPERIQYMLPYMVKDNWLYQYKNPEGIDRALKGMAKRASFESGMENAGPALLKNYLDFEADFFEYFPILADKSKIFIKNSLKRKF
jgi:acyl carrier protein phosphodiesterase